MIASDHSHNHIRGMTRFSLLDLVPVVEGGTVSQSLSRAADLARHAETLGFQRYWVAEHHGMRGIASAATAVVIGHVAAATKTIRVGAGGIMLPNHAPLIIAEQFGTLDALFPGRIDLGLGRAPGSDQRVAQAMRRTLDSDPNAFPRDVMELQSYFADDGRTGIAATPGAGANVPLWILGSSTFGAQLAAALGLPYAFASHFAPRLLLQAIDLYRERFRPSATLDKPYVTIGVPLIAAPTDEEAQYLASSTYQRVLGILTGARGKLPPPVANFVEQLQPRERSAIEDFLAAGVIGGPETVRRGLETLAERTGADEMMFVCDIFDPALRLRSLDIAAAVKAEEPALVD